MSSSSAIGSNHLATIIPGSNSCNDSSSTAVLASSTTPLSSLSSRVANTSTHSLASISEASSSLALTTSAVHSVYLQNTSQFPSHTCQNSSPIPETNLQRTLSLSITNPTTSSLSPTSVSSIDTSSCAVFSNATPTLCNREISDGKETISTEPSVTESTESFSSVVSVCITPPTQSSRSESGFVFTREQLNAFHAEINAKKEELKKRETEINAKKEELNKREAEIKKREAEPCVELDPNLKKYLADLETYKDAAIKLSQSEKILKEKNEQTETTNQKLIIQNKQLSDEIDSLSIKIDDLFIQIGHLEELVATAKRTFASQSQDAAQFNVALSAFSGLSSSDAAVRSASLIQTPQPQEKIAEKASSSWCVIC